MAAEQFDSAPQHTTMSPPIEPGEMGTSQLPSAWPKVIGIIAIVLGALGLAQAPLALLSAAWGEWAQSVQPAGQSSPMYTQPMYTGWTILSTIATVAVASLLLAAGIGITKRRRWGVSVGRAWALIKMALVVVSVVVNYQVFQDQMEAMQNDPNMTAMPATFFQAAGPVFMAFGIVWGWAFPVFLLIWFSRRTIKDETIAWS